MKQGFPGIKGTDKPLGDDKDGSGDYCYDPEYTKKAAAVKAAKNKCGKKAEEPKPKAK